jgi:hypothetical protein
MKAFLKNVRLRQITVETDSYLLDLEIFIL